MSDLDSANLGTVQSNVQPLPVRMTAAATIAPTTFLTVLTGNTPIATITPPVTGAHMLAIMPGTTTGFTTSGNIVGGETTVANKVYLFVYDPVYAKYYLASSTTT
jgi:hypothetical protein